MSYIDQKKEKWGIKQLCKVMKVSESGYYKHVRSSDRPVRHADLLAQIHQLLQDDEENANYGVRRIYEYLRLNKDYKGSYSTIYRLCRENNLMIKRKRRPNGLTRADAQAQKAENLIDQDFSAECPNSKWLTDITEVPCLDGKLYLAAILDCYDGMIVGFKADDNMKAELCIEAFQRACGTHQASGMVLHSDRGSQYTSNAFRTVLTAAGAIQSMSGTGRCYDNARMESFFATLKKEKLYRMDTTRITKDQVKSIIFRYIHYYNRRRIYSTNNGLPPLIKREQYYKTILPAAA